MGFDRTTLCGRQLVVDILRELLEELQAVGVGGGVMMGKPEVLPVTEAYCPHNQQVVVLPGSLTIQLSLEALRPTTSAV